MNHPVRLSEINTTNTDASKWLLLMATGLVALAAGAAGGFIVGHQQGKANNATELDVAKNRTALLVDELAAMKENFEKVQGDKAALSSQLKAVTQERDSLVVSTKQQIAEVKQPTEGKTSTEKKQDDKTQREEWLRQGRIAFNKETPSVQQSCMIALEFIKEGKTLSHSQIQDLSRYSIFHDDLVSYLVKSADKGGFEKLVKLTGAKNADKIRASRLAFGAYTPAEQGLILEGANNLKSGKDNIPSVTRMLENISILKELIDNFYGK